LFDLACSIVLKVPNTPNIKSRT